MKINFTYESFPTTWQVKYGNDKEQLRENILKHKKVYIIALNKSNIVYTQIFFNEDCFNITEIPYTCKNMKFLTRLEMNSQGLAFHRSYFKLLKKQGKKEYEKYIIENIKAFILEIEEQINELNITVYTNIEEWVNG